MALTVVEPLLNLLVGGWGLRSVLLVWRPVWQEVKKKEHLLLEVLNWGLRRQEALTAVWARS